MHLLLKRFFNQRIRSGRNLHDTNRLVRDFIAFYIKTMNDERDSKKQQKTRDKYDNLRTQGVKFLMKNNKHLYHIISSYLSIRTAKKMVIDQLNKVGTIKTFIGRVPTSPEGYVVHNDKSMMKFVDDEFRLANITVDKTWATK